ncbi:MAG TPA: methyltransferase domain-containing protein [Candidatus Dormibacteraeota bacterium]
MKLVQTDLVERIDDLARRVERSEATFLQQHGEDVEVYRAAITEGVKEILAGLRASVAEIAGDSAVCRQLVDQAAEYVDWLQWTLWDLPYFAVAMRPPLERFREAVAACGLAYLSLRVFDDVVDRHFWYKGRHATLLRVASEAYPGAQGAEGLTVLAGLMICLEGLTRLGESTRPELQPLVRPVLASLRRTVIGAVMEHGAPEAWNRDTYDRLVQLKNVDYWRTLYVALDADLSSPMYGFLARYYTLAQHLNDVNDFADDEARGQPNLLGVYVPRQGEPGGPEAWAEAEQMLADTFLELGAVARSLPETYALVAELKLSESLREARRLGLFSDDAPERDGAEAEAPAALGLHWHTVLRELLERAGPNAIERTDCPICGDGHRTFLFQKQGFSYHRCHACTHVYVSPRVASDLQVRIAIDMDGLPDPYLDVQRSGAATICQRIHAVAPGARLLDIGFGKGHVMRAARAYGFQVYGFDSSEAQVESLRQQFGHHLRRTVIGSEPLPGGPFDAVVMSHVVEHLPDPPESLRRVREAMSPGAVLYVAVPDIESVQFKILGKRWDVISPLVHYQYFSEKSMLDLLQRSGFIEARRVTSPVPPDTTNRWLHMVRSLGGTDSGELAVMARNPQ